MKFMPDDEQSRARLPELVTTAMDAIGRAQRRQRELGSEWGDRDRLRHQADEADRIVVTEYLTDQAAKGRDTDQIELSELEPLLVNGQACEERLRASRLAAEAAGTLVAQRIEEYQAAVREAAGLPNELEAEAAQLISEMNTALSGLGEQMRQWVLLTTLAHHVRAVQAGQEPQKVNTSGDDPALSSAVASARRAIRLRTQGATVDDMIASGTIFNVPVLPALSTVEAGEAGAGTSIVDTSETGVIRYPAPSR